MAGERDAGLHGDGVGGERGVRGRCVTCVKDSSGLLASVL